MVPTGFILVIKKYKKGQKKKDLTSLYRRDGWVKIENTKERRGTQ